MNLEEIANLYEHLCKLQHKNIKLNWDQYYLLLAKFVSLRSPDSETKHGCIIVKDKRPLGFGYNSYAANLKNDHLIPITRPDKYAWMIHAEINALTNCMIRPECAIVYVTGESCNNCLMTLWQNGIKEVRYIQAHGSVLINKETDKIKKDFLEQSGMIITAFPEQVFNK